MSELRVLTGAEVQAALRGREEDTLRAVRRAYQAHERRESSLPHSVFLRFPGDDVNRVIALPAYLGGDVGGAGIKWIASFPGNVARGMDRASAVMVLNSMETGRPEVLLEASVISARRTAASAALAARVLLPEGPPPAIGLIGCGVINFEIARFLLAGREAPPERLVLYDLRADRAAAFGDRCRAAFGTPRFEVAADPAAVLAACPLVSFATTAIEPHLGDLSTCAPGSVLLHVSLRDLTPEAILEADNVVDDVDHVCRARTSVHLAEQRLGHRRFIRCTLGEILNGKAPAVVEGEGAGVSVFSPFGLGILDVAVARLVADHARRRGLGTVIPDFFPPSVAEEAERGR